MRKVLTPARVSALLWVGALGVLVWLALDPGSPLSWRDELDSVERLPPERACALARIATPGGLDGSSSCRDFTTDTQAARLVLNGTPPHTVCFLKAARWFVVDVGVDIPCPASAPMEPVRITDFSDELRVEQRWTVPVRFGRTRTMVDGFARNLREVVTARRAHPGPRECPPLLAGKVEALDANLVTGEGPRWHFLSGDVVESVVQPGAQLDLRADALERLRRTPTLLLIDAPVKVLPEQGAQGRLEGTATLVDWPSGAVLCERPLAVDQGPVLRVEHGLSILPEPTPQEAVMTGFKVRVSDALADVTRELSDGGLVLEATW